MGFLGFDTSNYTTSVAFFDGDNMHQEKRLLPVKEGERGLRQSDAVFHHTKAYPELLTSLMKNVSCSIQAVGVSVSPTTQEGSYMPCFLVGEGAARTVGATNNVPVYYFSHQQGHIAAALFSAGKTELLNEKFLAFHVSGGTTDLVLCEPDPIRIVKVTPVASSSDLKAGQAVDRIGVRFGLKFPAGAGVEELARHSQKDFKNNKIKLKDGFCSLSGLENKCIKMIDDGNYYEDVAKFLLTYIADVVITMTKDAFNKIGKLPVVYAGGVMSDKIIRDRIQSEIESYFAEPAFSCDNAAGIAYLTYLSHKG